MYTEEDNQRVSRALKEKREDVRLPTYCIACMHAAGPAYIHTYQPAAYLHLPNRLTQQHSHNNTAPHGETVSAHLLTLCSRTRSTATNDQITTHALSSSVWWLGHPAARPLLRSSCSCSSASVSFARARFLVASVRVLFPPQSPFASMSRSFAILVPLDSVSSSSTYLLTYLLTGLQLC